MNICLDSNDPRIIAIYFLVCAVLILLFSFDIYFTFPYSRLFRFYHTSIKIDLLHTTKGRLLQVPYGRVLKQVHRKSFEFEVEIRLYFDLDLGSMFFDLVALLFNSNSFPQYSHSSSKCDTELLPTQ